MIKLTKGGAPLVLQENAAAWTAQLLVLLGQGPSSKKDADKLKARYRNEQVKKALLLETFEKCAYCESKFRHVTYGDIEHMIPKNPDPQLTFDWENLTIACDVCNTKKGECVVIDPYVDRPEERLLFFGAAAMAVPGDQMAEFTLRKLELNRAELLDRRTQRLEHLKALRVVIANAQPGLMDMLEADFCRELEDASEYAALSRSFHRFVSST